MRPIAALISLLVATSAALAGGSSIRINELRPNAVSGPQGGSLPGEVELYNAGAGAEDVSGYTLTGSAGTAVVILPAATVIPADGFLTVELPAGSLDPGQDELGPQRQQHGHCYGPRGHSTAIPR